MTYDELLEVLNQGEDSSHQFKGLFFADELETEATIDDFDINFFNQRYRHYFKDEIDQLEIPFEQLLTNIKLLKNDRLTLAGLLLFGKKPERIRPQFRIKGTTFDGKELSENAFKDKEEIQSNAF